MSPENNAVANAVSIVDFLPLLLTESILLFIVMIVLPAYAIHRAKFNADTQL